MSWACLPLTVRVTVALALIFDMVLVVWEIGRLVVWEMPRLLIET